MCTVAPCALPADCFRRTDSDDDGVEMETLLGNIHDLVHQPSPPRPMPSAARDLEVSLLGGRMKTVVQIAATTTPETAETEDYRSKIYADPTWTYESEIDATLRDMEKDPLERPGQGDYLWTTQDMTMLDRAGLVAWMYGCSTRHCLPPGVLHRAVSYLDRFLSAKKLPGAHRLLLGGAAMFAAVKYEDRTIKWAFKADDVATEVGGGRTKAQVLAAERDLVATLGYRLGGPTAHTFVDHFTRHVHEDTAQGEAVKSLAHHLADIALLDYRCVPSLPSAVATSAILLASRIVDYGTDQELLRMTGYALHDLDDIIDAIYEMHQHQDVWPGCALMLANCEYSYYLPPRW